MSLVGKRCPQTRDSTYLYPHNLYRTILFATCHAIYVSRLGIFIDKTHEVVCRQEMSSPGMRTLEGSGCFRLGGGFQDPSRVPFGPVSPRQVSQRDGPRSHWRWFRVATHPITATKNLQVTSSGISNILRIRRQSECAQECSSNRLARHAHIWW